MSTLNSPDEQPPSLGFAEQVEQLMKLPQSLCKQRGMCCKMATFTGSLSIQEIQAILADPTHEKHESAVDFLHIFEPYDSQETVKEIAPEFLNRVRDKAIEKGKTNLDEITFFKCKLVLEDGRCGVHEDRPAGCRQYPVPFKDTLYHPGCGFEKKGIENWKKIEGILETLEEMANS
ncbi:MAG: YkgJ family cysteine cluster protein [Cyanobacteria bacterium P01_H01_bin.74]